MQFYGDIVDIAIEKTNKNSLKLRKSAKQAIVPYDKMEIYIIGDGNHEQNAKISHKLNKMLK